MDHVYPLKRSIANNYVTVKPRLLFLNPSLLAAASIFLSNLWSLFASLLGKSRLDMRHLVAMPATAALLR